MELRASRAISALDTSFREFAVNGLTVPGIDRKQQRERQNSRLRAYWQPALDDERRGAKIGQGREQGYWRSTEVGREGSRKGDLDQGTIISSRSREASKQTHTKEESQRKCPEEGRAKEGHKSSGEDRGDRKDTEKERSEKEEGRPLEGGPHRCGARRGQSAAA